MQSQIDVDEVRIGRSHCDERMIDHACSTTEHFGPANDKANLAFIEREGIAGNFRCPHAINCSCLRAAAGFSENGDRIEVSLCQSCKREILFAEFHQAMKALRRMA